MLDCTVCNTYSLLDRAHHASSNLLWFAANIAVICFLVTMVWTSTNMRSSNTRATAKSLPMSQIEQPTFSFEPYKDQDVECCVCLSPIWHKTGGFIHTMMFQVLPVARAAQSCRAMFCRYCVDQLLHTTGKCPVCQHTLFRPYIVAECDRRTLNTLQNLKVKCNECSRISTSLDNVNHICTSHF